MVAAICYPQPHNPLAPTNDSGIASVCRGGLASAG